MNFRIDIKRFITFIILIAFSLPSIADDGLYLGVGLSDLDIDGENTVNGSIIAGYNFKKWRFKSKPIQILELGVEAQYSNSISDSGDVNYYIIAATARAYTSDKWFFKVKHGFTEFSDIPLRNSDAENSHFGVGLGVGYQLDLGSVELEYMYPNKTINASLIEISYKHHF